MEFLREWKTALSKAKGVSKPLTKTKAARLEARGARRRAVDAFRVVTKNWGKGFP